MQKLIEKNEKAKGFNLKDNRGQDVRLTDFKGKKVLLSFHPLAWTGICAQQMQALEENLERFNRFNCVALGLSIDTVPSKNAWAKSLGIQYTRLLSDFWPHGRVARAYGVFRQAGGFSERANILLDEKHKVKFVTVYPMSQLPDLEEIFSILS